MRRNVLLIILSICVTGILTLSTSSCKRSKVEEQDVIPNAGFRIALSGTANPSTLYVPETQPPVFSEIVVRALNSDGTPAANFDVIFQEGAYGYFDNFKNSVVKTTDASGSARSTYFLPPGVNIKASVMTNVTVTLVDNGRLDSSLSAVEDMIPLRLIPYVMQGIIIHGRVLTPAGNGVEGITVTLDGEIGLADAVTVTRPSGSYEFFVSGGWYGTIVPQAEGYTFIPVSYIFEETSPIVSDMMNLDFVAIFGGGNTLATDISQWIVPIEGGTQVVNVYNGTGDATIGYIVLPDSSWIHVSPNSGSTPGSFTITIDENTTGEDRNGNITINATDTSASSVTISISQLSSDVPSDARLAVDLETLNLPYENTSITINVYNSTTSDAINFIITSIPENDWIVVSATSGSTPGTLSITALDNYGDARTGQVILTPTTTGVSNTVTVTVNQEAGPSIAINIETKSVAVGGETFTVSVTNPTNSDSIPFTLSNTDSWISATPINGSTPAQVSITVDANGTGQLRTGVVYFTESLGNNSVTLTITQQGS